MDASRDEMIPMRPEHFDSAAYRDLLTRFLQEDRSEADLTTQATVDERRMAAGRLVAKAHLVLAGLDVALEVFRLLDPAISVSVAHGDGAALKPGDEPAVVRGKARALLCGERVALNILQRLTGVATITRQYAEAVRGTGAQILDTRKTTPGLRDLEKYAVTVGGGKNHRRDLSDAILIKDNHVRLAGGVRPAVLAACARRGSARFVEVEVTSLAELEEALSVAPDAILLDNMTPEAVRNAVGMARKQRPEVILEASGGIHLGNIRDYAEAGVDWISIGALTHSAPAADLSLEIEPWEG